MTGDVNPAGPLPSLRQAQIAQPEQRLVAAATELFLADGYLATTLEAVAKRAQVGAPNVSLAFGTKPAMSKRVVRVANGRGREPRASRPGASTPARTGARRPSPAWPGSRAGIPDRASCRRHAS